MTVHKEQTQEELNRLRAENEALKEEMQRLHTSCEYWRAIAEANAETIEALEDNYARMQRIASAAEYERDEAKQTIKMLYGRLNDKYAPPPGVVGYVDKHKLEDFYESGSQCGTFILDHPKCWEDEAPYPHLMALCAIDSIREHEAKWVNALRRLNKAALDAISMLPGGDIKAELRDAYDESTELLETLQ